MKRELETSYSEETQILLGKTTDVWVNQRTGEALEADWILKRHYGAKHFWKMYLMDFMTILGILDSKQLDILVYIAENTSPSNNIFSGTQSEVAEALSVSRTTVSTTFKKLIKAQFMVKKGNARYLVNPNIIMKGSDWKRKQILIEYENLAPEPERTPELPAVDVEEWTEITPAVGRTDPESQRMLENGQQQLQTEKVVKAP